MRDDTIENYFSDAGFCPCQYNLAIVLDILTLQDKHSMRTCPLGEKQARQLAKSLLFNLYLKFVQSNVIFSDNVHNIVYFYSSRYNIL